jgi:hypothetical protein
MKWSRLAYCAAIAALTTFLVTRGTNPWFTVPLAAFAAWWTFICTHALWSVASFRVAAWRLHLAPSLSTDDLTVPRKVKQWEWLSDPRLDGLVNVATTIVAVLGFPTVLWLPLIFWLLD